MSNQEKCKENVSSLRECLYNELNELDVTNEDYAHVFKVLSNFNIQNLGEYTELYIKKDVLLLKEIFEDFCKLCILTYNLDPC